ncbi:YfcZ/YiiS family protein [Aeromonas schubertii]|uniref:YfcZ/YiiS family protein n=1 Tax=Aeromonas schubertii TaxID=652 RepID=A0ABS7VAF1_9GAMM|nr:YfcZ/YiiS family protein [Aeromonas schubertii]MBZ6066003.1 YfcZ/YiiS family protein [Aeromonas schubertii]
MSVEEKVQETCDACGCYAEIGTIIGEGDDRLDLEVSAANETEARARLAEFIQLAYQVSSEVAISEQLQAVAEGVLIKARIQFTCTAEKLIFEMRARVLG